MTHFCTFRLLEVQPAIDTILFEPVVQNEAGNDSEATEITANVTGQCIHAQLFDRDLRL